MGHRRPRPGARAAPVVARVTGLVVLIVAGGGTRARAAWWGGLAAPVGAGERPPEASTESAGESTSGPVVPLSAPGALPAGKRVPLPTAVPPPSLRGDQGPRAPGPTAAPPWPKAPRPRAVDAAPPAERQFPEISPPPSAFPPAPPPPPRVALEPVADPRHRLAVSVRFALRLGDAADAISPRAGFALGGAYEWRYLRWRALELGLGLDFAHYRFSTSEQGSVIDDTTGMVEPFGATRVISETTFVALQTLGARFGRARPYLGAGAGVGFGYFDSVAAELAPGTLQGADPLVRATAGLDVRLTATWTITLRADYTHVVGPDELHTDAGAVLPVFGDLFDAGAGLVFGF